MQAQFKPLSCVLVKPAGPDCNLRCTYCFYQEKDALFENENLCSVKGLHRMSGNTLELMTKNALSSARGTLSFIWQGGEPTLMGLDFYKRAVKLQKKYAKNCVVSNVIQTNGTLLNDEWITFFKENNFLVGLSLDGQEHIHNTYRYTAGKVGTHKIVEASAKRLLAAGIEANVLSCVTSSSVAHIIESYQYLRDLGFTYIQFIPVVEKDREGKGTDFSVSPVAYGEALCHLFDAWLTDFVDGNPTTSIRLFETTFFTIMGQVSPECGSQKTCGTYVTVEHDGTVYPCDFFVERAHELGNVREHSLIDLLNSPKQHVFGNAKARLGETCGTCQWLGLCGGGCLKDRRNNPEGFERSYFCEALKMFYAHAVPTLQEMAGRWSRAA